MHRYPVSHPARLNEISTCGAESVCGEMLILSQNRLDSCAPTDLGATVGRVVRLQCLINRLLTLVRSFYNESLLTVKQKS
jgi:hypothetical protein